jgi:hypothetical protein
MRVDILWRYTQWELRYSFIFCFRDRPPDDVESTSLPPNSAGARTSVLFLTVSSIQIYIQTFKLKIQKCCHAAVERL